MHVCYAVFIVSLLKEGYMSHFDKLSVERVTHIAALLGFDFVVVLLLLFSHM